MRIRSILAGAVTAAGLSLVPALASASVHPAPVARTSISSEASIPGISPDVITSICDQKGNGHCLQAAGFGATVHAFTANGQPNQEFNFFLPSSPVCGDNITDPGCPFPGVTAGQQITVMGGQSAQNAGLCGGWSTGIGFSGTLVACNGGTGTVFVLDGYAVESAFFGRQLGHKTYLCEGGGNGVAVFSSFSSGSCQWAN
jgi:hypothetical protein